MNKQKKPGNNLTGHRRGAVPPGRAPRAAAVKDAAANAQHRRSRRKASCVSDPFTGDGAYNRDHVYRGVCQRHPDAAVIRLRRSCAHCSVEAPELVRVIGPLKMSDGGWVLHAQSSRAEDADFRFSAGTRNIAATEGLSDPGAKTGGVLNIFVAVKRSRGEITGRTRLQPNSNLTLAVSKGEFS
jgi:hypothetical protein